MLNGATIISRRVETGQTVRGGFAVKFGSSEDDIREAGANSELAIGVAHKPGKTYAAGEMVEIICANAVVPVVVGTGGCTAGKDARMISDGFTDVPAFDAAGATVVPVIGKFLQTGVAGDHVGMVIPGGLSYRIAT
jgi:hypothetical protein